MMKPDSPARRQVFLAAMGDVNDPLTWSGIPYYFLQAGKHAGMIHEGLALTRQGAASKARRLLWNATQLARGRRHGGFQYTEPEVRHFWKPAAGKVEDGVIVNCFQLFPLEIAADSRIDRWYYLDMPLHLLWEFYGGHRFEKRVAEDAIRRERDGYHSAAGLIANSDWAARSLREFYGVPAHKIHVEPQSASLDAADYARWEALELPRRQAGPNAHGDASRPPRLLFIGRDWRRKGLDRLLGALRMVHARGFRSTLRVIGCEPGELPHELRALAGVEWSGVVSKRTDAARFLRLMSECDVGCLLSRKEAGGVSLREFLAMGLAVIGPNVGGAPEQTLPAATVLVEADASKEAIAEIIIDLERNPDRLHAMREAAWCNRRQALWSESIARIKTFWPYPC